jgi:hypothetical protein
LPGGATKDRGQDPESHSGILEPVHIVWVDDGLNRRNFRMASERHQARADHRLAGQDPVLLRLSPACAQAAPGRDHNRCNHAHHVGIQK